MIDIFKNIRLLLDVKGLDEKTMIESMTLSKPGFYACKKRGTIQTEYIFQIAKYLDVPASILFMDLSTYVQQGLERKANEQVKEQFAQE